MPAMRRNDRRGPGMTTSDEDRGAPLRVHPARLMEKKQQERRSWRKRRTEKMHTGTALQERCTEKEEISWLESSSNLRDILQSWRRQGARNRVTVHLT